MKTVQKVQGKDCKSSKKNKNVYYMNENESLENLDEIINKLNDQLGIMGNNLIEKQIELDYLKEVNEQLTRINKILIDQLNKKTSKMPMNL
jgi:hypothetical protein